MIKSFLSEVRLVVLSWVGGLPPCWKCLYLIINKRDIFSLLLITPAILAFDFFLCLGVLSRLIKILWIFPSSLLFIVLAFSKVSVLASVWRNAICVCLSFSLVSFPCLIMVSIFNSIYTSFTKRKT